MDQFTPVAEIALGTLPLLATLMIHGFGMYWVQRAFRRHGDRIYRRSGITGQLFFNGLVVMMLTTHLIEILVWSLVLIALGAIPGLRDAFYYVAGTYTTLGYGEGTLPKAWRLLAPMIAISGLFTFGWTTGVLVHLVELAQRARRTGAVARLRGIATDGDDATSV
jgi:hypothetical protein